MYESGEDGRNGVQRREELYNGGRVHGGGVRRDCDVPGDGPVPRGGRVRWGWRVYEPGASGREIVHCVPVTVGVQPGDPGVNPNANVSLGVHAVHEVPGAIESVADFVDAET